VPTSGESILIFFALFWAIGFQPLGQYRLFETHVFSRRKAARFGIGMLFANLVPLAVLVWALKVIPPMVTAHPHPFVPSGVVSALLTAMAIPGVRRFIHGLTVPWSYRDDDERDLLSDFEKRWKGSPCRHLLAGVLWIVAALILAYVVAALWGW